jgi:hypothetical protein
MKTGLLALPVVLGLAGLAADAVKTQTPSLSAPLPPPGFHHIHMNSANPGAAIDAYLRVYPASTKVTVAGFEGLMTANGDVAEVKAAHKAGKTVDEAVAGMRWPDRFKVCPPQDTFVSQYEADYAKFHIDCVF